MDWLEYENKNIARGFLNICGVDEAGRGIACRDLCVPPQLYFPKIPLLKESMIQKSFLKKKRGFV